MGMEPDPIGSDEQALLQPLYLETFDFAQRVATEDVVVQQAGEIVVVQTATAVRRSDSIGVLISAATVDGTLVVATDQGLFADQNGALESSPINALLNGIDVRRLHTFGRQRLLWIAAADRLLVWDDGVLSTIDSPNLSNDDCQLAFGAYTADGEAVYAACNGELYGIARETMRAFPTVIPNVVSVAVDQSRTLWAVDADGRLNSRPRNRGWHRWEIEGVVSVYGAHDRAEVWVATDSGAYRFDGTEMHKVNGVPAGTIGLAPNAGILVNDGTRLLRVLTSPRIDFAGIEPDGLVEDPTVVTIHPVQPELVASIEVQVDEQTVTATEAGDRWAITLEPTDLADGVHTLQVAVTYQDNSTVEGSLRFSRFAGPPPTWLSDVQPLFQDHCVNCHGELSGTAATRLHTVESWTVNIDEILYNLRGGLMPLGAPEPLPDALIERVEGWKAAGYLVGDE